MKCVNILHLSFRAKQFNSERIYYIRLWCREWSWYVWLSTFHSPPRLHLTVRAVCMTLNVFLCKTIRCHPLKPNNKSRSGNESWWGWTSGLDGVHSVQKRHSVVEKEKRNTVAQQQYRSCVFVSVLFCYLICMQKWMKWTSVLSCKQKVTERAKKQRWQRQW